MPTTGTAGQAVAPAVTVAVEDAFGNVVTTNTSNVKIAIASGPGGLTTGSTTRVAAVAGVATFNNLVLDTACAYTLQATDNSLTAAVSSTLTINPGISTQLAYVQIATTGTAGHALFSRSPSRGRGCVWKYCHERHLHRPGRGRHGPGRIHREHDQRRSHRWSGHVQQSGSGYVGDLHADLDRWQSDEHHFEQQIVRLDPPPAANWSISWLPRQGPPARPSVLPSRSLWRMPSGIW